MDSFHLKHQQCFDARFFFLSHLEERLNSGLVTVRQLPGIPSVFV